MKVIFCEQIYLFFFFKTRFFSPQTFQVTDSSAWTFILMWFRWPCFKELQAFQIVSFGFGLHGQCFPVSQVFAPCKVILSLAWSRLLQDILNLAFFSEASRLHLCQSRIKTLQFKRHISQRCFSISDFPRQPQPYLELTLQESCMRVKIKVRIGTSHRTQDETI